MSKDAASTKTYNRAIELARAALAINAKDALAHATIAACFAKSGRAHDAEPEIRAAIAIDPTNANVLYDAAVIAALRGDTDSGVNWLRRAVQNGFGISGIETDPDLRALHQHPGFHEIIKKI